MNKVTVNVVTEKKMVETEVKTKTVTVTLTAEDAALLYMVLGTTTAGFGSLYTELHNALGQANGDGVGVPQLTWSGWSLQTNLLIKHPAFLKLVEQFNKA